ncbi:hypothetical protein B0A48_17532 [Cryoendolithus antarcticus]|uniref:Uncharacterized protein n=1 Tax=Cryoendolithus antarcticus TaxID=1507870 RepID=A0A1V8SBE6_9PEZI|nr:hypothetical protein B0A48_17532 [Cryoendolithus antarcticus]
MTGAINEAAPLTGATAIASLWDQKEYSDITIKEQVCASLKEIELKDDDPEAFKALLEHLYQIEYDSSDDKSWRFYLALRTAADKYLLPELESEATQRFENTAFNLEDITEVVSVLRVLDRDYKQDQRMMDIRSDVHSTKLDTLLKCAEYRAYLNERPSLLWFDLYFSRELLARAERPTGAHEHTAYVCGNHEAALVLSAALGDVEPSSACIFRGKCKHSRDGVRTKSVRFSA